MSGNKSLKPPLYNGKGGQDGAVFLMKFGVWVRTQDMGILSKANFEPSLPAIEATWLD